MSFRFLEHTADVRVECRAATFEALLESAAQALYAVALKTVEPRRETVRRVELAGVGRDDLLVRWLQELVYLLDTARFVATGFVIDVSRDGALAADLAGYACESSDRAEEVKAATYHALELGVDEQGYLARFILDL